MTAKITIDMSREAVVEHVAGIMRDAVFPGFEQAPAPEWAVGAAERIVLFFEVQVAQRLSQEDRLLRAAYRWLNWLEEPGKTPDESMAVLAQWSTRVTELLGAESGSSKPEAGKP
jgi:hypothetical protein